MVDLRKQNKKKTKKSTHKFLGIATYYACTKFQGKISNPTLVGAPGSLRFLNKRRRFFAKTKSLSKITYQCFSVQNQYNQTITMFCTEIKLSRYSQTLIKLYKC